MKESDTEAPSVCAGCKATLTRRERERRLFVCPRCGHHDRIGANTRLTQLLDPDSFRELDAKVRSRDVLEFPDTPSYGARLAAAETATGHSEAVVTGLGAIGGTAVAIGVFDFRFMGGSMGSAVGERLARVIDRARTKRLPLVLVTASGGARMQEGMYSLMQMAKLAGVLGRLREAGVPYVSVMTDPTTGGVAASVALLGDVNLAEPGALVGFAGPRVIATTPGEELPADFQRSEFLFAHGMIDQVVERRHLRSTLTRVLTMLRGPRAQSARRR